MVKKKEAGYIKGVMDHLHRETRGESGCSDPGGPAGGSAVVLHPPVEQQQQCQCRQVGGRHVGVLLEADEDQDHQQGRDAVVTLQGQNQVRGQGPGPAGPGPNEQGLGSGIGLETTSSWT